MMQYNPFQNASKIDKQRKKYKFLSNHTKLIFVKQGHKHILMFCRDSNVMLLIYSCRGEFFKNEHVYNRHRYCPLRKMILHKKRPIDLYSIINMSKYD